ncbi:MAG: hypothetical protein LBJ84_06730, partial [Oscillospiraceae bacterium]|nr:hypothetical protein [Oscillospiraceae bacterium]
MKNKQNTQAIKRALAFALAVTIALSLFTASERGTAQEEYDGLFRFEVLSAAATVGDDIELDLVPPAAGLRGMEISLPPNVIYKTYALNADITDAPPEPTPEPEPVPAPEPTPDAEPAPESPAPDVGAGFKPAL